MLPRWESDDVIPTEEFPPPIPKHDIRPYGFLLWRDFFSPRQLLVQGTFVEVYRELLSEIREVVEDENKANAILAVLGMAQAKMITYGCYGSRWDPGRGIRNVFERHDFAFKWTYAEFDGARELCPWAIEQILDAYSQLSSLLVPAAEGGLTGASLTQSVPGPIWVTQGNAGDLPWMSDGSVESVCIDPPLLRQRDVCRTGRLLLRMGEAHARPSLAGAV